jgi:hypothetical protein
MQVLLVLLVLRLVMQLEHKMLNLAAVQVVIGMLAVLIQEQMLVHRYLVVAVVVAVLQQAIMWQEPEGAAVNQEAIQLVAVVVQLPVLPVVMALLATSLFAVKVVVAAVPVIQAQGLLVAMAVFPAVAVAAVGMEYLHAVMGGAVRVVS